MKGFSVGELIDAVLNAMPNRRSQSLAMGAIFKFTPKEFQEWLMDD
eukprot:CAMPEP_0202717950 /NCGR_PEP_ID=MMETSP1385-20130828/117003_1 /ASSEMBLY_ACC=CAM_ASM_000861 /TAXON_ID=933848 /ORGANISM="Elphidium margaritaceum" /LENGTH=45 /DNA_ID= /DNA_START= /DNA_END= /DNA_ORIENTATION=